MKATTVTYYDIALPSGAMLKLSGVDEALAHRVQLAVNGGAFPLDRPDLDWLLAFASESVTRGLQGEESTSYWKMQEQILTGIKSRLASSG